MADYSATYISPSKEGEITNNNNQTTTTNSEDWKKERIGGAHKSGIFPTLE